MTDEWGGGMGGCDLGIIERLKEQSRKIQSYKYIYFCIKTQERRRGINYYNIQMGRRGGDHGLGIKRKRHQEAFTVCNEESQGEIEGEQGIMNHFQCVNEKVRR